MLQTVKGKPRNLKEVLKGQRGEGFPGKKRGLRRFLSLNTFVYWLQTGCRPENFHGQSSRRFDFSACLMSTQ